MGGVTQAHMIEMGVDAHAPVREVGFLTVLLSLFLFSVPFKPDTHFF